MNQNSDFQNPQPERNPQSDDPNPEPTTLNPTRPARGPRRQSANPFGGPGRPRKLDEIALREICALVSAGCGIEGAARYVGCAASTVRREALRNDDFGQQLRRAHLTAELAPLNAIREAAKRYWRAGAWLLERTNPQRFARQTLAFMKPDHLHEYKEILMEIIREETADTATSARIGHRVEALHRQALLEVWVTRHDSCPPRRARKRQSAMRAASALPRDDNPTDLGSSDAPAQT
jgi:hypothetical protein